MCWTVRGSNPGEGEILRTRLHRLWGPPSFFLLDHTRHTTVGRNPLDEWSVRRRDLYLTTHNTQQTDIHVPGGIRTHDLSRRAAVDLRLRPRGHWDRQKLLLSERKKGEAWEPSKKQYYFENRRAFDRKIISLSCFWRVKGQTVCDYVWNAVSCFKSRALGSF